MQNTVRNKICITALGVTSSIGQGKSKFIHGLLQGNHAFGIMQREGRQNDSAFLGAEIQNLLVPDLITPKLRRRMSFSSLVAATTLHEAWKESKLANYDPNKIGLIIGGSNFQQRELAEYQKKYLNRPKFISPNYGASFLDSDMTGICTELFNIRGYGYTLGGASASGQLAIIQAVHSVLSGQVDVCIALGALMDISFWELQALKSIGAMGSEKYAQEPGSACRPFDKSRDGFIYGESCGALIIESESSAEKRGVTPYATIRGWATHMDGNHNPNPSYDGEVYVIQEALKKASLKPEQIDYINPHGTGSIVGDETEVKAIFDCGLSSAYINTTKSITGHGLSAAGAVEIIATLLQMKENKLHPSMNLADPINTQCNWVRDHSIDHKIRHALSISLGFGGTNTALCLSSIN